MTRRPAPSPWRRPSFAPGAEFLESRRLLAGAIQEFPIDKTAGSLATGSDGNIWFTQEGAVGRITPAGVVTSFADRAASGPPGPITPGPDASGNLWFASGKAADPVSLDAASNLGLATISPSGVITNATPAPSINTTASNYGGLTVGPDGSVWYTHTDYKDQDYPVRAPDGIDFFSALDATDEGVASISPPQPGSTPVNHPITPMQYTFHGISVGAAPPSLYTHGLGDVVDGHDGNLWFTETVGYDSTGSTYASARPANGLIGRLTPAGDFHDFAIGPNLFASSLTPGPGGAVWFVAHDASDPSIPDTIDSITPDGTVTPFPVSRGGSDALTGLAAGGDGNLWFTSGPADAIGRMTPRGAVTRFVVPTPGAGPAAIIPGPGDTLWFAEAGAAQVARVDLAALRSPISAAPGVAFSVAPGVHASGSVASFTSAAVAAAPGDFTASIDWGDGTPATAGTVAAAGPGGFQVLGAHTYASPGVFAVTTTVADAAGDSAVATGSATVPAPPVILPLTGRLDPASVGGPSSSDGITAVNRPRFVGTAAAGATVVVFAREAGRADPVAIGVAQADASGSWVAQPAAPLADGVYVVTAAATGPDGLTATADLMMGTAGSPLVIAAGGPRLVSVSVAPGAGGFSLGILADPAAPVGLGPSAADSVAAFVGPRRYSATSLTITSPDTPGGLTSLSFAFAAGRRLHRGQAALVRIAPGAVRDALGTALSGGPVPGIYRSGGDYRVRVAINRRGVAVVSPLTAHQDRWLDRRLNAETGR